MIPFDSEPSSKERGIFWGLPEGSRHLYQVPVARSWTKRFLLDMSDTEAHFGVWIVGPSASSKGAKKPWTAGDRFGPLGTAWTALDCFWESRGSAESRDLLLLARKGAESWSAAPDAQPRASQPDPEFMSRQPENSLQCPGCDNLQSGDRNIRQIWSCFVCRCGPKRNQQWKDAKKVVYDSLDIVEGIRKPRKSTRDPKLVNMEELEKHLIKKIGDRNFITFFTNHPHLQKVSHRFTFPIEQSPPVVTEISPPPLFSQGSGSPTRVNQPQLAGMSPRPPSPGAQPLASEDGFFPGQAMREGMLAFKFFAPTSDILIFLRARGRAPLRLHCPDACPLLI